MDPLSIVAGSIAILQAAGATGKIFHTLLSLRDAPQVLQQLRNEVLELQDLLRYTTQYLKCRQDSSEYPKIIESIIPTVLVVRHHVTEFEDLIRSRLSRVKTSGGQELIKVNRSYWLRATQRIRCMKQNLRESREMLSSKLELLSLTNDEMIKEAVREVYSVATTNQSMAQDLKSRQQDFHLEIQKSNLEVQQNAKDAQAYLEQQNKNTVASLTEIYTEQRQDFTSVQDLLTESIQPMLARIEHSMSILAPQHRSSLIPAPNTCSFPCSTNTGQGKIGVPPSSSFHTCPKGCRCDCHTRASFRTPPILRNVFGQLLVSYNTSFFMRSCNISACQRSVGNQKFTYYFPSWLIPRAVVASASFNNISSTGAKIMVSIPLIVPEEDHIIWSLVMAGNVEQLRLLLQRDKNLVYARNQWGQSMLHVSAKIHQPAVFDFLLSLGMDEHAQDENQKSAATTILTRRGNQDYDLPVDAEELGDRLDWTILHQVAALNREGYIIDESLLESAKEYINSRDVLGRTPLHWLAENGKADAIRLLTQDPWRASVHVRDNCGFTALHCACWADDLDSVCALLDAGSDPNARDKHERTPLLHLDGYDLLEIMIEKGADVSLSDDEGCNIMHHVAIADQAVLAKTILEEYGDSLCVPNHNGDTPFGLAVQNNSLEVLAVMLPSLRNSNINPISTPNRNSQTALHLAALYGSTEAMDILSKAELPGLDPDARDKNDHTPNDCFLFCREAHCAITRKSDNIERSAWVNLLNTIRAISDTSLSHFDSHIPVAFNCALSKRKDSVVASEASDDSDSDEEYLDAEDAYHESEDPLRW